jgi:cytochrome c-type biogenesis protein CcmF
MHGLIIERSRGVFRRSNLLLAMFSFLLVVYGTFLTRSGVLADFSVHSFTDLGISSYLVFFMVFFLALSVILLLARARSANTGAGIKDPFSVDFAIVVGIFFVVLLSALTLVGTSAPLITRIFGEPSSVSTQFYNTTALPMAIIIALLAGLSPFLVAKEKSLSIIMKRLTVPLILSLVSTIVAMVLGVYNFLYLLMVFFSCFALFGNIVVIYQQPGRIGLRLGGFLTHMGFGVMMVGIVVSSAFSQNEKINLYAGQDAVKTFQYKISYKGMAGDITTKDNAVRLEVDDGGSLFQADPKLFVAKENQGIMRKPYIHKYLFYDLYLSPQEQQMVGEGNQLVLSKGGSGNVGDYQVTFTGFDMGNHGAAGDMQVGAVLEIKHGSDTGQVVPRMTFAADGKHSIKTDLPGGEGSVMLEGIQADQGKVSLTFAGVPGSEVMDLLILEVSKKPLINFVWLGIVMVCVGTYVSYVRRRRLRDLES